MSQMYTRKLIDFLYSRTQQTEPLPNAGTSMAAEFDWPPSAQDLEAFSIVHLRDDEDSESQPVLAGFSEVA